MISTFIWFICLYTTNISNIISKMQIFGAAFSTFDSKYRIKHVVHTSIQTDTTLHINQLTQLIFDLLKLD